jgi:hypothetical protein
VICSDEIALADTVTHVNKAIVGDRLHPFQRGAATGRVENDLGIVEEAWDCGEMAEWIKEEGPYEKVVDSFE